MFENIKLKGLIHLIWRANKNYIAFLLKNTFNFNDQMLIKKLIKQYC